MTLEEFFTLLQTSPETIEFAQTMQVIEDNFIYTPAAFTNGDTNNESGTNEGSCKIFAFGRLNSLPEKTTLACFGAYYREDVLQNPNATDHANIRNFMVHGWPGIKFESEALELS